MRPPYSIVAAQALAFNAFGGLDCLWNARFFHNSTPSRRREQTDKESPRARAGKRFSSKKRAKALARLAAKCYK